MRTDLIVSLKDTKAGIYSRPTVARSKADFVRSCQIEAKNPESMLHKFPADYDLVILGGWSEEKGILFGEPERLGSVLDLCPLE